MSLININIYIKIDFKPLKNLLFVSQGNSLKIEGSDQTDGSNKWTITAELVKPGQVTVDFSSKGGPKDLLGFSKFVFFFNILLPLLDGCICFMWFCKSWSCFNHKK